MSDSFKAPLHICDEDGDNLDTCRTIPSQVGGAGVLVLRGDESIAELALAAGAVGSSFDAEAFAAVQEIAELEITRGSTVRWFTDSKRCTDALNGQPRMYGEMMRKQWDILENIKSREVNIECIWIQSHCAPPGWYSG